MPVFWFCASFIIGIAAAPIILISRPTILLLVITAAFISIIEYLVSRKFSHPLLTNKVFKLPIAMLILGFILGLNQYHSMLPKPEPNQIHQFSGIPDLRISGRVISDPERATQYTSAVLMSESITANGTNRNVTGKVRLTLPQGFPIQFGDRLELRGQLKRTFPEGSYPHQTRDGQEQVFAKLDYPQVDQIISDQGSPILSVLFRLRQESYDVIFNIIPFPESSVFAGMLLGVDEAIPGFLWEGYRTAGIAHIIVISGFNISLVAHTTFRQLRKIARFQFSMLATLFLVLIYTILVGADTPVVRAAIMAIAALPAASIGRKAIGVHSLGLAAAIMLAFNPFQLWDISFQLSFLATLALLVMADPVSSWIIALLPEKEDKSYPIIEIIVPTLCASIVVFPILFRLTGTVSLVSIPANILVAPLQPMIMVLGGAAIFAGLISPLVGQWISALLWPLIAFCNQVALRFSAHPEAAMYLPGWLYPVSSLGVVILLTFFVIKQFFDFQKPGRALRED